MASRSPHRSRRARFAALPLAALLLSAQTAAPPAPAGPDEIVVTAGSRRCEVKFADRALTAGEFKRRAAEWAAGKPVRVVSPAGMSHACMARIAFRLARHGVRLIEYVDRADPSAATGRSPAAPAIPR